jgi:hypothetical protein
MADARDFELLDDYLTNRLSPENRSALEAKLQADPDLQQELILQKRLVQGIKDARVAELKSMLNNVPVSALGPEKTIASKLAIGTALSALIAAGAYWYFNQDNAPAPEQRTNKIEQPPVVKDSQTQSTETENKIRNTLPENNRTETDKNQTSAGTEDRKPSLERKPAPLSAPEQPTSDEKESVKEPVLDVFDPTEEERANENAAGKEGLISSPKNSSLVVETDTENRKYSFHYQFKGGKLFLYGPLEKNLYEIMEFFSDEKRTVFLFYKDNYYLLDERDANIRPLTAIIDPLLLKKLKAYRSTK